MIFCSGSDEVAVVYYRAGSSPEHYTSEEVFRIFCIYLVTVNSSVRGFVTVTAKTLLVKPLFLLQMIEKHRLQMLIERPN